MKTTRKPNPVTVTATIAAVLLFVPAVLTGCAKRDRMDGAVDKGVAAGKKASEYKQGAQERVNSATAILDAK